MADALKGNMVVGQSGGPTCVINQSLVGLVTEAMKHSEIGGIYGAAFGVKGILAEDFIDLRKESREALEAVARTPCAALGSVRKKPTPDECARIFDVFRAHDVRYYFYIGGNDSAETAFIVNDIARQANYDIKVFHVPKTIDNDLLVTDHCPGYGTAARFVALALLGDDRDNRSLPGVKIDVVMGRHAGFLTAAAALGRTKDDDGPHLVYVPERPFSEAQFVRDVDEVNKRLGRCIVAVSEGISDASGKPILETKEKDSHGNVQLSGTGALGDYLSDIVKKNLGEKLRVRSDTFGYLQRSFPTIVSEVDAAEARRVGEEAVRFAVGADRSGSVAMRRVGHGRNYRVETFLTPLDSVAKKTKSLDAAFIAPAGNDVTRAFVEYAAPLAGPLFEPGRLAGARVPKRLAT
ncbi:MAG: 6-phosphofructokinase [Planctomycetes bacterium]|nr:6-phosphofructokinase [Planctomycetota bacterium]MBI3846459.1 6-phosphofructokinase [Planctomycetota bacterium]